MNTNPNRPDDYQVIVSNVGVVYSGNYASVAQDTYKEYVRQSKEAIGKAAGEDVTAMFQGEPYQEYVGAISEAHNAAQEAEEPGEGGCNNPHCTACKLSRLLEAELRKRQMHKDGELGYVIDNFITRISKVRGIEVEEEQKEPLYKALMNAVTSNTNGG